jgi:hypothetical protein
MDDAEARTWAYILKNRKASDGHIAVACDVSMSFVRKLKARIASPNWQEEVPVRDFNEGVKFDTGKPRYDLIPPEVSEALAQVLTFGANKYSARNWENGMNWGRAYGALQRHLNAFWAGEDKDPETGMPHTWHAACCIAFLISFEARGVGKDDRSKLGDPNADMAKEAGAGTETTQS